MDSVFVAAKLLTGSDIFDFRTDCLDWNNEMPNCHEQSFIFEPSFAAATSASSTRLVSCSKQSIKASSPPFFRAKAIKLMGLQSLGDPKEFSNVIANGLECLEDLTLVANAANYRAENLRLDYSVIFSVQGENITALCLDSKKLRMRKGV